MCLCYYVVNMCACFVGVKYKSICVLVFLVLVSLVMSSSVTLVIISNLSTSPVLAVMNVYTSTNFLLTIFQCVLPTKTTFFFVTLVLCICNGTCAIIHHYNTVVKTVFFVSKQQLSYRYFVASCKCILMGIAGSCGVGLLFVLALVSCRRHHLKLLLKYTFTIPYISMPLGEQVINQRTNMHDNNQGLCKIHTTLKRARRVGQENACQGDNIPPPKRGRKSKTISDEHRCGSCTVWLQSGSNEKLLKYHSMDKGRVCHPGVKSIEFSLFLSCNGAHNITLRSDSCMCDACYRDCLRGEGKPHWVGLSKHLICKHCFICCLGLNDCACECITEWVLHNTLLMRVICNCG